MTSSLLNVVHALAISLLLAFCRPALSAGVVNNGGNGIQEDARRLFDGVRSRIYQIRSVTKDGEADSSTGSGFLVGDDGLIATNWHVIDDYVLEPDTYRLEARRTDGKRIPVRVVAIDSLNDLALLRADGETATALELTELPPEKGEKGFAFGDPKRVGFTVVEGTFNGVAAKSMAGHYHFTGAINSGMSGGPVLDRNGKVFGVIVARRTDADLMGFLIPVERLVALISRVKAGKEDHAAMIEEARQGMVRGQEMASTVFISESTESRKLGNFRFPIPPERAFPCSGRSTVEEDDGYKKEFLFCHNDLSISAGKQQNVGLLWTTYGVVRNVSLDAFRFSNRVAEIVASEADDKGDRKVLGRYSCRTDYVALKGVTARVTLCLRSYLKLQGLKDAHIRFMTLDGDTERLAGKLILRGFTEENIRRVSRRFLETIEWKP